MSGDHLPAKPAPSGLAFDPRTASPMVRRGMERLSTIVAAKDDGPKLLWSFVGYGRHKTYEREPPTTLPVQAENIPEELKRLRQWVCWEWALQPARWGKYYGKESSKGFRFRLGKPPISPRTGASASEAAPETWASFAEAVEFCGRHGLSGVGFVFTPEDPYAGLDLDMCLNPKTKAVQAWASRYLNLIQSYTELSPSGLGIHIVIRGQLPGKDTFQRHDRRDYQTNMEMYDRWQYFAFTGHLISNDRRSIWEQSIPSHLVAPRAYPYEWSSNEHCASISRVRLCEAVAVVDCWDGHARVLDSTTGRELWCWRWDDEDAHYRSMGQGLIIMVLDGDLVARESLTGAIRWRIDTPGWANRVEAVRNVGDTRLVMFSSDEARRLVAIDQHTGRVRWIVDLSVSGGATHMGGLIYVADEHILSCRDALTGDQRWTSQVEGHIGQNVHMSHAAGVVIVQSTEAKRAYLSGLDGSTGQHLWTKEVQDSASLMDGSPAGIVLYDDFESFGPRVLDPVSGQELWSHVEPREGCLFAEVTPDTVIAQDLGADGGIVSFDSRTGEERWSLPGTADHSIVALRDGVLIVRSHHGSGHGETIEAFDERSGRPLWRMSGTSQS